MKVRKAVLPVAGLGTRFLPATKVMPKEMLTVVDRPLIQYAVEEAWAAGIEHVILVTSRGKELLEDHLDRSFELETALRSRGNEKYLDIVQSIVAKQGTVFVTRQLHPLGLGHAVLCAREMVGNEPFAVILPDDLIHSSVPVLKQMVKQYEQLQTSMVAVMEVDSAHTNRYGIIDFENSGQNTDPLLKIKGLIEKPPIETAPSNLAVIGRYILTPEIFDHLATVKTGAGGEIQLTDAMAALLQHQSIYGYRYSGIRYDCGDKVGYQMANLALSLEREEMRERLLPFLAQTLARWLSPH
ncbi:MAG: UTP--glucose-1-phosphate uridylyltransferase GalU [Magnetococcus sp. DMHC-6]